jgi:hypothetical protein
MTCFLIDEFQWFLIALSVRPGRCLASSAHLDNDKDGDDDGNDDNDEDDEDDGDDDNDEDSDDERPGRCLASSAHLVRVRG